MTEKATYHHILLAAGNRPGAQLAFSRYDTDVEKMHQELEAYFNEKYGKGAVSRRGEQYVHTDSNQVVGDIRPGNGFRNEAED
jgi:hypothetical protein